MKKISLFFLCIVGLLFSRCYSQTILNESFDGTTFVPAGWYKAKIYPSTFPASGQWERVTAGTTPVLSPHSGAGMARFDSPSAGWATISELGTSALNLSSGAAYRVRFWVYRGDNAPLLGDQLDIYISTQQNITGAAMLGTIFISRMKTPTEAANGWYEYVYDLPASFNSATNYIIFRATGASSNVVYLDDVQVEAYTCYKPINTTVGNLQYTSAALNWSAPATGSPAGYEWEVRANGSGGTGATGLTASGATAAGQTTAIANGLVPGGGYNFYVRSSCGTEKSTWSNAVSFYTPCSPASIPYTENFDAISTGIPACTITENINGGSTWTSSVNTQGSSYANSAPNAITCSVGGTGASGAQNDWFYTSPLGLEAGKCYQLSFACRTSYYAFVQSLKVKLGTAQNAASMTLAELFNSTTISNSSYAISNATFTVAATGTYYIGFNHFGTVGNGPVFVDDISVTESVGLPTAINSNPVGSTTAQLNWSAPACGVPSGYEWELRTSGTAGSGATGLISNGNGTGLSTTFTGLTENKSYSFYIRSSSGALNSAWSSAFVFQTICSTRTLPYTENFDGVLSPAYPACITKQDLNVVYNSWNTWLNYSYDKPYSSPNCMRAGTNNSTYAGNNWFFTPPFNFIAGKSYRLQFYYRNDIYSRPEKLEIKYGADANAASMTSAAVFSNTDIRNAIYKKAVVDFVPTQNGNYNIGFHFFSDALQNFLYVDDIKVDETPACDVVRDFSAVLITSNTAMVKWQAPVAGIPAGYNWELRTSGAAGSGATGLINAGALAAGALSLSISGLTAGTNYSLYIRSNCGAQNSEWAPFLLTTACSATYVPYNENFDGVAAPAVPTCTKVEEFFDQYKWSTATGIERSSPNSLYHPFNFSSPFDDWFFTAALQLTAGRTYQLSFYFREQAAGYIDALEIKMGRYAQGDSMTSAPIYVNTNINNTTYQLATVTFTVPATGVYYLGLHSIFDYQSRGLSVDDFGINEMTPDLFISNQSLSAATAATSEVITANFTLNNQGLNNAGASKTYFYLSADNVLTPGANGDTLIGLYNHASSLLAGTNTGSIASVLNIPCNLAPGNYTLFFVADGETAVTEINETNNSASSTLTITAGAQWNGSINNNWETAGNWSCSQVPGPTTDVTINTGTVVVNAGTTIRSLTVKPGVSFTLAPGVVLTVLH